ncbi:unnamed protein product [Ascophyllum nodosum]
MEFHDLGKHCTEENCGQQDFLPFKCDACSGIFCLEHRTRAGHSCTRPNFNDKRVLECPDCNRVLKRPPGVDHDVLLARHLESGCAEGVRKARPNKHRCSAQGCRGSEFVKVICKNCRNNFCFRHRHEDDHLCQGIATVSKPQSRWGGREQAGATASVSRRPGAGATAGSRSESGGCGAEAGEAAARREREACARQASRDVKTR